MEGREVLRLLLRLQEDSVPGVLAVCHCCSLTEPHHLCMSQWVPFLLCILDVKVHKHCKVTSEHF